MNSTLEIILRLIVALLIGFGIGYQRERAGKAAGLRTHGLVALGAALFTVTSIFGFENGVDPSRVAAGIVVGIGFLGAGVIFRGLRSDAVAGLTTAASIWATAALGLAIGAGMYLVGLVGGIIAVGTLMIPKIRG